MKKLILTLVLASFAVSAGAFYDLRRGQTPVRFQTTAVTRGDITASVACTGTLEAVTTVDVGTQASGIIKELNADFNSVVHRGEVLARLDPALIQTQIDQGRAEVASAKSDLDGQRVALDEANRQLTRVQALFSKALVPQSDLDDARAAQETAAAQLKATEMQVAAAQAGVDQAVANLEHTIITSPIDGIVIARNVDVGQTVVSQMQAQSLFVIANDVSRMRLMATVDESDVARVREGEPVTFGVDAYPSRAFNGTVSQVRVNPNIDQNVVTYTTVVDVPNPDLKLRPGMTANVTIRVDSRSDATRLPTAALQFKPYEELFALLRQPVPSTARAAESTDAGRAPNARNLRAVGEPPPGAGNAVVWIATNGRLEPIVVRTGITDGTNTEMLSGALEPGDQVVTNVVVPAH